MEQHEIKLVEEDNTIYEIDMTVSGENNWQQKGQWRQMRREGWHLKRTGQKRTRKYGKEQ
mgnify:CR=1 FL=1